MPLLGELVLSAGLLQVIRLDKNDIDAQWDQAILLTEIKETRKVCSGQLMPNSGVPCCTPRGLITMASTPGFERCHRLSVAYAGSARPAEDGEAAARGP